MTGRDAPDLPTGDVADPVLRRVTELAAAALEATLYSGPRRSAAVAVTPWLTPRLAAALAEHPDSQIRARLARNKRCPTETLSGLAHDRDARVRDAARNNPNLPYEAAAAAGAPVLRHPDCPLDLLLDAVTRVVALPANRIPEAAHAAAEDALLHPRTPTRTRLRILDADTPVLWRRLLWNPATTQSEADMVFARVRSTLPRQAAWMDVGTWASHDNAASSWLAATLNRAQTDPGVRGDPLISDIAAHPATPVAALAQLAGRFPQSVARNPSASVSVLHQVLEAPKMRAPDDTRARQACFDLAINPSCDRTVLARIPATVLGGMRRFEFASVHAATGTIATPAHAEIVCRLATGWSGNIADLLDTAADLAA